MGRCGWRRIVLELQAADEGVNLSTPQPNVEAYQLLGDILTTLRAALRVGLEREYGQR